MKKRDWIMIALVLCVALVIGAVALADMKLGKTLRIMVDGELYEEYSLEENREISIGETNVCEIVDGVVRMTEATCPDQICVHTTEISREGMTIVCLPNRIVLEIAGKGTENTDENQVDGVS